MSSVRAVLLQFMQDSDVKSKLILFSTINGIRLPSTHSSKTKPNNNYNSNSNKNP